MMQVCGLMIAVCAVFLPGALLADPKDCFCLENEQYDYFQWGCIQAETGSTDEAVCIDAAADAPTVSTFEITEGWKTILAGTGLCQPCMPEFDISKLPVSYRGLFVEVDDEDGKEIGQ